ncbi:uncharacterized protein LOC135155065 [Lytechinus pictus]|uniref:uncharacterized protein LOC135155065 n=1 Tax=Lytechinus pictus TaxID=7653 RepID=UPI0030BA21F9
MPVFKLWRANRLEKKMAVANTYEELCEKAKVKLGMARIEGIVLEEDGTEIDDDEVLLECSNSTLMVLEEGEHWELRGEAEQKVENRHLTGAAAGGDGDNFRLQETEQSPQNANDTERRITAGTPLPPFSQRVLRHLEIGKEYVIWKELISEAANYYLTEFPTINSSTEYAKIGQKIYSQYPTIRREGEHQWSFFTKCLSQKIRHIRWQQKKKTNPKTEPDQGKVKRTNVNDQAGMAKRARCAQMAQENTVTDDSADQCLKELSKEWTKPAEKRCLGHIRLLLEKTFATNQKWIMSLPDAQVEPILKRIPCYSDGRMILHDFQLLRGRDSLDELESCLQKFMRAIEELKSTGSKEGPLELLPLIQYIEKKTAFDRGKGSKTEAVISIKKEVPDEDVEAHMTSGKKEPPRLVIFVTGEEDVTGCFIVSDEVTIDCKVTNLTKAFMQLIAAYYVFNLEYPKMYSQLLGLVQSYVLKEPYNGQKSSKYRNFEVLLRQQLGMQ